MQPATQANSASYLHRMGNEYWPKCCDALWLGSKSRMGHSIGGQTCGWQVELCDPLLTRDNLSALEMIIAHIIKRYTNIQFTFFTQWLELVWRHTNLLFRVVVKIKWHILSCSTL